MQHINSIFFVLLCFVSSLVKSQTTPAQRPVGRAYLEKEGYGDILGTVDFSDIGNGRINIVVNVTKELTPGQHGFHVHEFGDLSNVCQAAGPHYNPLSRNHGGAPGSGGQRHEGDFGNIVASSSGSAFERRDNVNLPLTSILGRSAIVHALPDDLGRRGDQGSRTTGNSGARFACGIIGLVRE